MKSASEMPLVAAARRSKAVESMLSAIASVRLGLLDLCAASCRHCDCPRASSRSCAVCGPPSASIFNKTYALVSSTPKPILARRSDASEPCLGRHQTAPQACGGQA